MLVVHLNKLKILLKMKLNQRFQILNLEMERLNWQFEVYRFKSGLYPYWDSTQLTSFGILLFFLRWTDLLLPLVITL